MSKEEFLTIYNTNIKRDGADKLLDYLEKSDFFVAPASKNFHNAFDGGLFEHSINVYKKLLQLVKSEYGEDYKKHFSDETIAICGLLHDICKIDCYKKSWRNQKIDGVWEQVPVFIYDEALPYGHGEKSVYIINGFIRLTREEAMAINWHMGAFDARVKGGSFALSEAFEKYPLAIFTHVADMMASYLDEEREKKI